MAFAREFERSIPPIAPSGYITPVPDGTLTNFLFTSSMPVRNAFCLDPPETSCQLTGKTAEILREIGRLIERRLSTLFRVREFLQSGALKRRIRP